MSIPRFTNERMMHTIDYTDVSVTQVKLSTSQEDQPDIPWKRPDHGHAPPTKRSEVLRHVFPRPMRSRTPEFRKVAPRIMKNADANKIMNSSRTQSRPRVAFHKYITSFFGNSQDGGGRADSPLVRSRASSSCSRPESSMYGSVPSVDVVSPASFIFSGPNFPSAGSFNNSTSRLSSSAGTNRDIESLRRAHTDSFSMLEDSSIVDEEILEPVVEEGIMRNVSDVLFGISTPTTAVTSSTPLECRPAVMLSGSAHRAHDEDQDSSYSGGSGRIPATSFPASIIARLLSSYLDDSTRNALRLSNRTWYCALSSVITPKLPASYCVPIEIIQHIYDYLGPKDFNAARHTCRNWMRASLDKAILTRMFNRGGWTDFSGINLEDEGVRSSHYDPAVPQSEAWAYSRHLARQCALASGWTGNGLEDCRVLVENSEIDFTELANGPTSSFGSSGILIFATSVCNQFLCVARGTLIYIYDLRSGHLTPVTSVLCPKRVLSISMDVSSGRHAIAALLEGRMGMVCDLHYSGRPGSEKPDKVHTGSNERPSGSKTSEPPHTIHQGERSDEVGTEETQTRAQCGMLYVQGRLPVLFNAVDVRSSYENVSLRSTDDCRTCDRNLINQTWNLSLPSTLEGPPDNIGSLAHTCVQRIPIETGTSTYYDDLCSEDDPPRSVAICPQRRCVVFGCSAGIALQWVDALTGQSLNRDIPLTATSDYLYFLPSRIGFDFDSPKRLRLISSAAHPSHRSAISRKFLFRRSTASSFWGSLGFEANIRGLRAGNCDHYRAVPLSDGHHVLFIDPSTGRVTLGYDAPPRGSTKLLRKIFFVPPNCKTVPSLYTAAADMSQGTRVVVAYNEIIMLYSIPPGVCDLSRGEQRAKFMARYATPPFAAAARSRDHWLNWWDEPSDINVADRSESDDVRSKWPLCIRGTEIGRLSGVCEVAIQTRPDILIWAFSHTSQCRTWRLPHHTEPAVLSKQYVCHSGIVHEDYSVDTTGDVIMQDAPPLRRI